MLVRIITGTVIVFFVQATTVNAQLFKNRRQAKQPSVVHVHHSSVNVVEPTVVYRAPTYIAPVASVYNYEPIVPAYHVTPTYLSSPVVTASAVSAAPAATITANKVPLKTPSYVPSERSAVTIKLSNPVETEGTLHYTLNDSKYSIKPGESQELQLDRDWVIQFDNGYRKQVTYRLTEGTYEFVVDTEYGWDVVKRSNNAPVAPPESGSLAARTNVIPRSSAPRDVSVLATPSVR